LRVPRPPEGVRGEGRAGPRRELRQRRQEPEIRGEVRIRLPALCDTDHKVGLAYGAADDPEAGSAKRISYLIGKDGRIKKAWGKVDAASHPAQALQEI
jgi:peroxiredoxin